MLCDSVKLAQYVFKTRVSEPSVTKKNASKYVSYSAIIKYLHIIHFHNIQIITLAPKKHRLSFPKKLSNIYKYMCLYKDIDTVTMV